MSGVTYVLALVTGVGEMLDKKQTIKGFSIITNWNTLLFIIQGIPQVLFINLVLVDSSIILGSIVAHNHTG
jgi:hypothetical protein